jgi:serine protease Do
MGHHQGHSRRTHLTRSRRMLAGVAVLALLLSACGDRGVGGGGRAVGELTDVQNAVIQIVARGTFVEPAGTLQAYEEFTGIGSGSGFIIDPSGIAVTNNHVVTGAAALEVFVGGDTTNPRSARVLGVSECADLAVIQIDGDGFSFLEWYDGDVVPGLEVRAAGFPLGDPQYTLTAGIVAKADFDGNTNWASVERVIEHDANIQPGNSGGPLVTRDGKVVGVNYRGRDPGTGTTQFFAVGRQLAVPLIDQLRGGQDVHALGVNGVAVVSQTDGVAGIWVSSVDTNSPARSPSRPAM